MKVLLDTHAFLWFIADDARLGPTARQLIEDRENQRLLSIASLWEVAIKMSIGKLRLDEPFAEFIPRQIAASMVQLLPIEVPHLSTVATLPFHHRDPFDRLFAAQALTENLVLLSCDTAFDAYGVDRRW